MLTVVTDNDHTRMNTVHRRANSSKNRGMANCRPNIVGFENKLTKTVDLDATHESRPDGRRQVR